MTILFVGGWLLRSCLLILAGAALVKLLPVKTPAVRLAAWTALLAASLAIPILNAVLPQITLAVGHAAAGRPPAPPLTRIVLEPAPIRATLPIAEPVIDAPAMPLAHTEAKPIDWARLAAILYFLTAGLLLLRLFTGLLLSLRLYRRSRPTGNSAGGAEIHESTEIASPVTVGLLRPVVLLPPDWRHWSAAKLAAVLAHEASHIRRRDPAIQFVSAIHRALLWASPASWLLDHAIVRCAEQVSDDDAIAATHDRASYAETLLDFFQQAADPRHALVVPMARHDRPETRIRRILRSTAMPAPLSRARIAAILLAATPVAYFAAAAHPQSKDQPAFDLADVHMSPRSEWVASSYNPNPMQGGYLTGDRYELRRATMLDLIRMAYNRDSWRIFGGPSWLAYDRYEIVARTKAGTPPETLQRMLQHLLQERFHLVVKEDNRPMPAYLLARGKGELRMKPGSANASGDCTFVRMGTYGNTWRVECRNVTMEKFAEAIRPRLSLDPTGHVPVVDSTGLKGTWDFDVEIPTAFGASVAREVEKLGLKCELGSAPQQVLVVENVNEQPTPNSPDVTAKLPPLPPPAFEVASLKQGCTGRNSPLRFEAGGRVTGTCQSLAMLINWAWGTEQWGRTPSNLPFGLPDTIVRQYISIVAQAPAGIAPDPQHNAEARETLYAMLRTLLIERYRMRFHYEDRPVETAVLTAVKPKLTQADPSGRSGCTRESVPPTESGSTEYTCRNLTMAQFAEQLRAIDITLHQVEDATELKGAWDFRLSFNFLATINRNFPNPGHAAPDDRQAPDPDGELLLADALEKQLGLKLQIRKRPAQVLVIDHIEPTPVGN
jgi:uncharacterized protein (TIGR03435 family)